MLGRKQSLRGEHMLADYGPDDQINESSETEWASKVIGTHLSDYRFFE